MEERLKKIEEHLKKIDDFIESLKNPNTFPKEIRDALINVGFLKFDGSISYEAGAGGNFFEEIFVKYLNQRKMIGISQIPFTFVVASISSNTCSFINTDISPLDIQGQSIQLYTSGTLPGGLDLAVPLSIINCTATTFQISTDGVNPIDITSAGSGTQYLSIL